MKRPDARTRLKRQRFLEAYGLRNEHLQRHVDWPIADQVQAALCESGMFRTQLKAAIEAFPQVKVTGVREVGE